MNRIRQKYLLLFWLLCIFFLINFLFFPKERKPSKISAYNLPNEVPLKGVNFVESRKIDLKSNGANEFKSIVDSNSYFYKKENLNFRIDAIYLTRTGGDVPDYLNNIMNKEDEAKIAMKNYNRDMNGGYYSIFMVSGNAVLTSCVNPQGASTVTNRQFVSNRATADITFKRLVPWLLNQTSLKDERCLWTYMTTHIQNQKEETSYLLLEEVWTEWQAYWSENFPSI